MLRTGRPLGTCHAGTGAQREEGETGRGPGEERVMAPEGETPGAYRDIAAGTGSRGPAPRVAP